MNKIGIVTIAFPGTRNYGNKLQTFALQEFLRSKGFQAETIRYLPDYVGKNSVYITESRVKKVFTQPLVQTATDVRRIFKRAWQKKQIAEQEEKRNQKFDQFERDNIIYTNNVYDANSVPELLAKGYACFITGSDQVWNPYYEGAYPFYYLNFAPKGRRIAYAPSIAVKKIPEELKSAIGNWMGGIDRLSIREIEGRELIKREYGLDAQVVCDPVFLLSRDQWQLVSKAPCVSIKYFAVYILGKKTYKIKKTISSLEKNYGLKAIDIYDEDDASSFFAGPEEFIGLISNAEFVLTNSFHGAAFSVIYEKPFIVTDRDSQYTMNSRLDNLKELVDVPEFDFSDLLLEPGTLWERYRPQYAKMQALIRDSQNYLLSAIETMMKEDDRPEKLSIN